MTSEQSPSIDRLTKLARGLEDGTLGVFDALELSSVLWELKSAVDAGDDKALWRALSRIGIERRPRHRPKDESDAALLRHCEVAAVVQILSSVTSKTEAIRACASGLPASESVVWASCKTVGVLQHPMVFAGALMSRVRQAVAGDLLNYSEELRQFLEVTR